MVARLIFSENLKVFLIRIADGSVVVQVFNIGASKAMIEQARLTEERRAHPRRRQTATYRIAEFRNGASPENLAYRWTLCCDISDGGCSYRCQSPPSNAEIVLDLTDDFKATVYMLAHVRNVRPTEDGRYLVGCEFVRRLN
jgi:hypothetical protein